MTDLLPSTTELPETPTLDLPEVRAVHRRHGPRRSGPVSARARRGTGRGRSFAVALAVTDALLAMFLLGTWLSNAAWPDDLADRSASRSTVPSSVAGPPVTGGGEPVAVDVAPRRQGGSPDGGAVTAASTSTTAPRVVQHVRDPTVVHDAAPARGQTQSEGPAGGPASTTTAAVASTVPSTAPPVPVAPSVPETVPEPTPVEPEPDPGPVDPPDTIPETPSTETTL